MVPNDHGRISCHFLRQARTSIKKILFSCQQHLGPLAGMLRPSLWSWQKHLEVHHLFISVLTFSKPQQTQFAPVGKPSRSLVYLSVRFADVFRPISAAHQFDTLGKEERIRLIELKCCTDMHQKCFNFTFLSMLCILLKKCNRWIYICDRFHCCFDELIHVY